MSVNWKTAEVSHDDMARISTPHAAALVKQAGIVAGIAGPLKIFDNAAGSGVVTAVVLDELGNRDDVTILAGDINKFFLDVFKVRKEHFGWKNVDIETIDAMDNKLPDNQFTHVIMNFGIMLMPESMKALHECTRVLVPGGTVAFSTWQKVGWVVDTKAALDMIPDAPTFPDPLNWMKALLKAKSEEEREKWEYGPWITDVMQKEGYQDIQVTTHTAFVELQSPKEWAESSFIGFLGNMLAGLWGKETYDKVKDQIPPAMLKQATEKYGEGNSFKHEYISILTTARKP